MPAPAPVIPYGVPKVTSTLLATAALAKTGDVPPVNVTTSAPTIPTNEGEPLTDAVVVPSYTLFDADKPVIVSGFAVITPVAEILFLKDE